MHCFSRGRVAVFLLGACVFLASAQAAPAPAPVTEIELILDASGSMWNKLEDGRFRIDAAKQVLSEFVIHAPARPDLRIGLRIYGSTIHHSRPGACNDSELLAPIAPLDRARLLTAIREVRAIGATPLARSLNLATQDFREGGRKQVIVCTDGEESCGGDVANAVATLKSLGAEVDVRFIGIGLPPAVAARLGKFAPIENVNSARRLAEALGEATKKSLGSGSAALSAPVKPGQKPTGAVAKAVPVTAHVIRDGKPLPSPEVSVAFRRELDGSPAVNLTPAGEAFSGAVPRGSYAATLSPGGREYRGLAVVGEQPNSFTFDLTTPPDVSLTPEKSRVTAGTALRVAFAGAKGKPHQYLVASPVGSSDAVEPSYAAAPGVEGAVDLYVPDLAGEYEIRFTSRVGESADDTVCGRSAPVQVVEATATIEAPAAAFTGQSVPIKWEGPNRPRDWVGFIKRGGTYQDYLSYAYASGEDFETNVDAPLLPGEYEVVYGNDDAGTILARRPISVTQPEVTIDAPASAMAGSQVAVKWTGPGGRAHFITIVKPDAAPVDYNNYASVESENPASVTAPDVAGEFEVRYASDATQLVLARRPILLTPAIATLDAPASALTGVEFAVRFTGPGGNGDRVELCPAGSADDASSDVTCPADHAATGGTLRSETAGSFELRYLTGEKGRVLARRPILIK